MAAIMFVTFVWSVGYIALRLFAKHVEKTRPEAFAAASKGTEKLSEDNGDYLDVLSIDIEARGATHRGDRVREY